MAIAAPDPALIKGTDRSPEDPVVLLSGGSEKGYVITNNSFHQKGVYTQGVRATIINDMPASFPAIAITAFRTAHNPYTAGPFGEDSQSSAPMIGIQLIDHKGQDAKRKLLAHDATEFPEDRVLKLLHPKLQWSPTEFHSVEDRQHIALLAEAGILDPERYGIQEMPPNSQDALEMLDALAACKPPVISAKVRDFAKEIVTRMTTKFLQAGPREQRLSLENLRPARPLRLPPEIPHGTKFNIKNFGYSSDPYGVCETMDKSQAEEIAQLLNKALENEFIAADGEFFGASLREQNAPNPPLFVNDIDNIVSINYTALASNHEILLIRRLLNENSLYQWLRSENPSAIAPSISMRA